MIKKLILALAFLPSLCAAAGSDLLILQRLPDDSSEIKRLVTKPAGSGDGVLGFVGSTQRPSMLQLGQGLQLSGGVLSSTAAAGPVGPAGPQGPSGISKRIETYTGTTNASGQIVVTYPTAFAQVPNVQPPAPPLANQVWTTISSTVNGFTLQLNQRNTVVLLSTEVLLGATAPVSGAAVQIVVIER